MVYGRGLRVEGKSEIADAPEWRLPGDRKIEQVLGSVAGNRHATGAARRAGSDVERSTF